MRAFDGPDGIAGFSVVDLALARRRAKFHPISNGTAGLRGGRNRLKFAAKPPFSGMNL
jgi:hypothetical protein